MKWNEYRIESKRTINADMTDKARRCNAALGLIGEVGEAAELMKHAHSHGVPIDLDRLTDELGDICWYVAEAARVAGYVIHDDDVAATGDIIDLAMGAASAACGLRDGVYAAVDLQLCLCYIECICGDHGIEFGAVLQGNINKLRKRHPGGFTIEGSVNRNLTYRAGRRFVSHRLGRVITNQPPPRGDSNECQQQHGKSCAR
jgi:NTP pyrophosphatase (non-canonical NTP hydrolase)